MLLPLDKKRMIPSHWFKSVVWVSFIAITLLFAWQEWHLATFPKGFSSEQARRWKPRKI